jgi:hypothetical protein
MLEMQGTRTGAISDEQSGNEVPTATCTWGYLHVPRVRRFLCFQWVAPIGKAGFDHDASDHEYPGTDGYAGKVGKA